MKWKNGGEQKRNEATTGTMMRVIVLSAPGLINTSFSLYIGCHSDEDCEEAGIFRLNLEDAYIRVLMTFLNKRFGIIVTLAVFAVRSIGRQIVSPFLEIIFGNTITEDFLDDFPSMYSESRTTSLKQFEASQEWLDKFSILERRQT